jgi:two-component system CheB/CheR fusion protein
MAFVLVPHLDPTYESQMVPLLSKVSLISVVKATQGIVVEPGHAYVIPSNHFLAIENGVLQLTTPPTPQGRETAIDFFLQSLAKDQGEHAVGIVLSGTGSHGTLGVQDIKRAGGMGIAQEPTTAEFDAMPTSIIRERLADFVLPPKEMAERLIEYFHQSHVAPSRKRLGNDTSEAEHIDTIVKLLRKQTQYDFNSYRKNMMLRRVRRRMGLLQLDTPKRYIELLEKEPEEINALYRDLLISVTAFFRDPEAFEALRKHLLPVLKDFDGGHIPYRIWVPGCATGEEAYSLALLCLECLDDKRDVGESDQANGAIRIQVYASDVDEAAKTTARTGNYSPSIANDVSKARIDRFFIRRDEQNFQIGKQLRESVVFSRQNLIHDAPFSKIDLISCRNLLIYLEPEMQQKVISLLHFSLNDNGILMLGPSESLANAEHLFEPISKKWRIFKKIASNQRVPISVPLVGGNRPQRFNAMRTASTPARQSHKELVEKNLVRYYAPATVLVNRNYDVLYITGPLVDYLEFPSGEPNHNLLYMCRQGLRTRLRFACKTSFSENVDTKVETEIKRGNETINCSVHVRIVKTRHDSEPLLLISFTDIPAFDSKSASELELNGTKASVYSDQLERELKLNSEELGSVIEELEGANEDLKSSNEEIMSMNEELQSANEELETSKEELQSLNEELSTVNLELLEKVTDLDIANNDILNLLTSTDIATLFLDEKLLIQRFTPPTLALLNLRSSDIGRPLSDITTRFVDDFFLKDCETVIQESLPIQNTVEGANSRIYLRRILPYRSQGDQVLGVVITFVDLTERLLLEKSLKQSKDHLEAILDSAVDAILTVDNHGVIARLNPATERLFGYSRERMLGKSVVAFLTLQNDDSPTHKTTIQRLPMPDSGTGNYLELKAKRNDGSDFDAELTVSRIEHSSLFIVVIRDATQRKNLEKKILEIASDEQRRIGQELHDGTQQELTGLSLIAGTIEDFLSQRSSLVADDHNRLTLDEAELSRLILTTSKLVQGLNAANRHVQSLSHGIMPVQIDVKGLHSALSELADETSVEGKVDCKFVHSGSLMIKSNAVATHLYRIAQEAINNAQRHGAAKNICVSLSADQHRVLLEITDDGCGMDAASMNVSGKANHGAGLQIMTYRASVIDGALSVVAGNTKGTIVRCTIPK